MRENLGLYIGENETPQPRKQKRRESAKNQNTGLKAVQGFDDIQWKSAQHIHVE